MMTKTFDGKESKPSTFRLDKNAFDKSTPFCVDPTDYYIHMRMKIAPQTRCLYVAMCPSDGMTSSDYGTAMQRFEWDRQGTLIAQQERPLRDTDI
eukprot:900918-Rhodomonas_salina.2